MNRRIVSMVVAVVLVVQSSEGPLAWRKSTRSMGGDKECVQVGFGQGVIAVRDSKDPDGPVLVFETAEWMAFVHMIAAGRRAMCD